MSLPKSRYVRIDGAVRQGSDQIIPNAKELVSLRIDRDILDHFQESEPGWQDRISEALRKAVGK